MSPLEFMQRLDGCGISYQYLDGSTPAAEHGKRVVAFQRGEGDLFLISLKADGILEGQDQGAPIGTDELGALLRDS